MYQHEYIYIDNLITPQKTDRRIPFGPLDTLDTIK